MNTTERLRLKIERLTAANDRQAETITRQSRANSELRRINAVLTRRLDVTKRDIAELQRAGTDSIACAPVSRGYPAGAQSSPSSPGPNIGDTE